MSEESHFIHDILTPLSVAHAHIRLARDALGDPGKPVDLVDLKRRVDRSYDALEKLVALIFDRRNIVSSRPD